LNQGGYAARIERLGIPTVHVGHADLEVYAKMTYMKGGCPNIRYYSLPRIGVASERVAYVIDKIPTGLTTPLSAKEQEKGTYVPPPDPRITFEGTLDDAQEFFGATTPAPNCGNCPTARFTDGLPIIIPTEEKVKQMLTGTSHQPSEMIKYQLNRSSSNTTGVKGMDVVFIDQKYGWKATVEKVAVNAVMAGCKPQYLPVVLAMAVAGTHRQGARDECRKEYVGVRQSG
jgi:hypothetical protein